jgi:hypothetical protein
MNALRIAGGDLKKGRCAFQSPAFTASLLPGASQSHALVVRSTRESHLFSPPLRRRLEPSIARPHVLIFELRSTKGTSLAGTNLILPSGWLAAELAVE